MRSMELTALLGSRICHDLISPLGAIGNGVELLAMSGIPQGPEMSLIAESVENANARIRFFRVAFGAAPSGQVISRNEITDILAGLTRGGRLSVAWQIETEVDRRQTKLAFLCLQCLESAMPWGGRITVSRRDGGWTLVAESTKLRDLDGLWNSFDAGEENPDLAAADIQFALAPLWARDIGMRLVRRVEDGRITIFVTAA
jgi:histidine phosphotransferase ChpT